MKGISVALALVLAFCWSLRAEEIQLKDGTKITGKVIALNGDTFQIKTAYGEIQVPRSDILSITFPENQPKDDQTEPLVDESIQDGTYTNRTEHFQIMVPKGWKNAPEFRKGKLGVTAALKSADETLFFFFTPERFDGNLSTYKVLVETQYQAKFKDYQRLSDSEVQLAGRTGIKLVWKGKSRDLGEAETKFIVYILPYDGRMVRLSFGTLEPLFDDAVATFETMAASYRAVTP
jgi:hypothetical protein